MNTRPVLDSDKGPFALSACFNTDATCFSVALETGYRVFLAKTCNQMSSKDVGGGIGAAEMITTTQYLALVGGGKQPKFPQNKVGPEDADWQLLFDADIIHEVQIFNDQTERRVVSLEFKTPVQRVRVSKTHLIVVLLNRVCIYKMEIPPVKIAEYETVNNPFGLCELGNRVLAFPGYAIGQVKIFDLATSNVSIKVVHDSPLRALAISRSGDLLATASENGTIIRLWSIPSCAKLAELRRGIDPAIIFSLAFSPDNSTLAVTSDKSTLHIFELAPTHMQKPAVAEPDASHKYGILSKIPLLPRQFSDTYSTASAKFEMGEEPLSWGPHQKSATLNAGIPGVPGGRPTKGLIGWLDDRTILVLGAGQDARWERFVLGISSDTGRKGFVPSEYRYRRYLD